MPMKYSLLLQLNTVPTDLTWASPHIAGWSETIWDNNSVPAPSFIRNLALRRAAFLPRSARLIGYRAQVFQISGNQLVPGGTSAATFGFPGHPTYVTDLPQMAISVKATATGKTNTRKFDLRAIPDAQFTGGEFQPDSPFLSFLNDYLSYLNTASWWFPGRDLTQASVRVLTVAAKVLTTDGPIAGAVVGDFVRLLKVKDSNNQPVKGVFNIVAIAGNTYTLNGIDASVVVVNSGRARLDRVVMCQIARADVDRAVVKKVGRPFEQYRGRRSKVR